MSTSLIKPHQLGMGDILTLEANYKNLSDQQLIAAGANKADLSRTREALKNGELFYSNPQVKQALVGYSTVQDSLYVNNTALSQVDDKVLNQLYQRFPSLRDAEDPNGPLGSAQHAAWDPAPPVTHDFNGNGMGDGQSSTQPWLSLYFYEYGPDNSKVPVEGVPYKLLFNKQLIEEGHSPANGLVEWKELRPNETHDLHWGRPGSDDYVCSRVVPLQYHYDIEINRIYEILFSPNEHYCIALDKAGLDELEDYEKSLTTSAQQLLDARLEKTDDPSTLLSAQKTVRNTLREQLSKAAEAKASGSNKNNAEKNNADKNGSDNNKDKQTEKASDSLAPLTVGASERFTEVVRVGKQQYTLVPEDFIHKFKWERGRGHFFDVPSDIKEALRQSVTKDEDEPKDALGDWRYSAEDEAADPNKKAGSLNKEKLKETFGKVKVKMEEEWGLWEYKKEGQIPAKLLVEGVFGDTIADFFEEECGAIDTWVSKVNEDANVSVGQYSVYRDKALKALDKTTDKKETDPDKYFLPDDWDLAKRMVKDIWGEKDDLYKDMNDEEYSVVKNNTVRTNIREKIAKKNLPATRWDGSAGAQLMRYSLGSSVKAKFDLLDSGKLALGAEAAFDAALAEAKAEGSFYYPHSNGHPLKPSIFARQERIEYKLYGRSQAGDFFKEGDDRQLPYFPLNSCLLTPAGAAGVFSSLKHWSLLQQTGHRDSVNLKRRDMFIQVVGHTSATASMAYNDVLGLRRAMVTADFIRQTQASWLNLFFNGQWGQDEIDFMACFLLAKDLGILDIDWLKIGESNKASSLMVQLQQQVPDLAQRRAQLSSWKQQHFFITKALWHAPTHSPSSQIRTRLQHLVFAYRNAILAYGCHFLKLDYKQGRAMLEGIQLYATPFISKGETELKENTQAESASNRRCEFLAWEIDPIKSVPIEGEVELYLGDLRARFHGHINAWAGANLALGGEIAIAAPEGVLAVVGAIHDKKAQGKVSEGTIKNVKGAFNAGANASAFAGAKAEAGLKASVDWRQPQEKKTATPLSANAKPNELTKTTDFNALGSVGYTVTGMLGIGGSGELKIGFDESSGRFVVKAKAEGALGPGIGGQLNIVIGVSQLWGFVTFVHGELKRHNFSYLDMFETEGDESKINVFDLFSAFAWKMLVNGKPLSASASLGFGIVADQAIELLKDADKLVVDWRRTQILNEQAGQLAKTLAEKPEDIKYLTPETKGRILFDLIKAPYSWGERWDNARNFDINKRREDATLNLLLEGTHSRADWRETLEHMGDWKNNELVFTLPEKATSAEKAQRVNRNITVLNEQLLDDTDKWKTLMTHINSLPDNTHEP